MKNILNQSLLSTEKTLFNSTFQHQFKKGSKIGTLKTAQWSLPFLDFFNVIEKKSSV